MATPLHRRSVREQRANWCKHFNGIDHATCKAGVKYEDVRKDHEPILTPEGRKATRSLPCMRDTNHCGVTCDKQEWLTEAELDAMDAADKRHHDLMARGLTSCCEAPIDKSQVIQEGRYKGHGPRFCSKCKRCVFMV